MSIDIFETRTMLRALEERRPPKTFLTNLFFRNVVTSTTEHVDIDIIRNKRKLAPFVNPLAEGKVMDRQGYSTKSFKPPYIKPKMVTTAADILKRAMGENIYSAQTPAQRAAAQLAKDLGEMQDSIIRRVEWMCAQVINTGQLTVTGEGINAVINFQRSGANSVTLNSGVKWNQSGGTPVDDLRAWKKIVSQATGLVPNVCIMGSDAVEAFLANDQVKEILNRFANQTVRVNMDTAALAEQGVTFVGVVEDLQIFSYDEWYLDTDNVTELPMVPADRVWLGSTAARTAVHYGAILDLEAAGLAAVPYWPKSWVTPDPSARWVMLQSAPLVVPTQVDAFLSADVV